MKNRKKRGKLIVIEGVDGTGKTVQFNLLKKRFKENKLESKIVDFPRYYSSVWGNLVKEVLLGKHGEYKETSSYLTVLPYMLDEYVWSRDVGRGLIEKGSYVLSNRYFTSNVHQVARQKGPAQKKYRDWIWKVGYEKLGIMKPDCVIFLDIDPEIAKELNLKKANRDYLGKNKVDQAEEDLKHQTASYREYLRMIDTERSWYKVSCTTRGKLDSPEVIHDRIWKILRNKI